MEKNKLDSSLRFTTFGMTIIKFNRWQIGRRSRPICHFPFLTISCHSERSEESKNNYYL